MNPTPQNWAVVGGGMLGMTLAYRLAQQGQQVTLFEAATELGGLASAWQLDDIIWDRHYHVTLLSDLTLRSLLQELDLERDMEWVETKTGVYAGGKLYSVSNAIEFLQFPPLRLIDKLRLGLTILYGARIKNWKRLETIPVTTWLKRWSGDRTFQTFWLPLLRAKLGDNYKIASASFIWSTIARLYAARRTGLKKELFGYLPGGYARILKRFGEVLTETGVTICLGDRATQVRQTPSGQFRLEFENGKTVTFDRAILTTAAPIAARLCPQLSAREKALLEGIQYQGILCASALLKQPLSTYYVTNITDDWVPFTGIIEMTALVKPKAFGGRSLVYLPKYVPAADSAFERSDEELEAAFIRALERMYPHFQQSDVLRFQVSRVNYVVAVPTLNYSQNLPPMQTSLAGLHIVNSAHILNGTLNVNETVQLAEQTAAMLLSSTVPPS
ncbi:NAD(P)/FAD-dependent oxidoreductase [Altericista sp. CCNU0014]|uniref:NAD(P)/FAD-dependent oxidoreductase n=1 Tax=Altericista sp. CCNU0014 TaxID=3082949 RepID=UPI00384FBF4B